MAKSRISVVQYLNSIPLAWGILEGAQREAFDPVLNTPAECADLLASGGVDIGLIPSIEFQRIKGSRIVPGPVVASTHRVRSVLLISELPLWKVKTVAFDKTSRTSAVLARIVFEEFYHIRPDFKPSEPDLANMALPNISTVTLLLRVSSGYVEIPSNSIGLMEYLESTISLQGRLRERFRGPRGHKECDQAADGFPVFAAFVCLEHGTKHRPARSSCRLIRQ